MSDSEPDLSTMRKKTTKLEGGNTRKYLFKSH